MKTFITGKKSALALTVMTVTLLAGCNEAKAPAEEVNADAKAVANETATDTGTTSDSELLSTEQKVSYIIGSNMAKQTKASGFEVDLKALSMALEDAKAGREPRISQEDQHQIMMSFQQELQAKREAEMKKAGEENAQKGKDFLTENAKKDGVKTTESGLQYKVLSSGEKDAAQATAEDQVKVHYHGTLIDGTVFDSSKERGQPMTFPLGGVIKGWIEGLQLMKVGDKFEFYIPAELAYGERGSGKIGPNSALIFEVELLAVNPEPEPGSEPGAAADPHAGHGHGKSPH